MEYHYKIVKRSEMPPDILETLSVALEGQRRLWGLYSPRLHFIDWSEQGEADLVLDKGVNGTSFKNENFFVRLREFDGMLKTLFHEFMHQVQFNREWEFDRVLFEKDAELYAENQYRSFIQEFPDMCKRARQTRSTTCHEC